MRQRAFGLPIVTERTLEDFQFSWQRLAACSVYGELHVFGAYGVRLNTEAEEDDRGGHTAWEVWHWPSGTVESDWFTASDAYGECVSLENRRVEA